MIDYEIGRFLVFQQDGEGGGPDDYVPPPTADDVGGSEDMYEAPEQTDAEPSGGGVTGEQREGYVPPTSGSDDVGDYAGASDDSLTEATPVDDPPPAGAEDVPQTTGGDDDAWDEVDDGDNDDSDWEDEPSGDESDDDDDDDEETEA